MRVRLLPWSVADGPTNMALDEALLDAAVEGVASLRLYGWVEPTLSLGYFQPSAAARDYPGLGGLPWVRRHSGGAALVHHHELTYAVALPGAGDSWIARMHGYVRDALAPGAVLCGREERRGETLCFLHHTPGDLLLGGHKVAGSAQRKRRGALLQHGGVLLAQSEYTPELPGLAELTGRAMSADEARTRLLEVLRTEAGWRIEPGDWSAAEEASVPGRVAARYGSAAWNSKR
jgi:lipoate-protein ligase A